MMIENIPVFIYTFLACFSFCFIFKFHKLSHMIAAATGGMLSWVFYVACAPLGNDLAQYLISTIIVSAYAEVMARVFKAPVTGFLTIGILPLYREAVSTTPWNTVYPERLPSLLKQVFTPLQLQALWRLACWLYRLWSDSFI